MSDFGDPPAPGENPHFDAAVTRFMERKMHPVPFSYALDIEPELLRRLWHAYNVEMWEQKFREMGK